MAKIKPIHIEQLSSDTQAVFDVLNEEPDLACVLIGTNFLDQIVASLLKQKFIRSSVADKILNPTGGALGTFSARSDLVYCLGFIEKKQYQDLCQIAEIRNRFAHGHLLLSFGDPRIRKLCNQLTSWEVLLQEEEQEMAEDPTDQMLKTEARNKFNLSVVILGNRLLIKAIGLKNKRAKNGA